MGMLLKSANYKLIIEQHNVILSRSTVQMGMLLRSANYKLRSKFPKSKQTPPKDRRGDSEMYHIECFKS